MTDPAKLQLRPDWELVTDGVMGGVSDGEMTRDTIGGRPATLLRGDVSLDNNGGFIQIAFDLCPDGSGMDASAWDGVELEVHGNGRTYELRLRTEQLARPWQSFRAAFDTDGTWQTVRLPFSAMTPHKTEARFDAARLRRIGILAIGREFHAEIAVAAIGFYRA